MWLAKFNRLLIEIQSRDWINFKAMFKIIKFHLIQLLMGKNWAWIEWAITTNKTHNDLFEDLLVMTAFSLICLSSWRKLLWLWKKSIGGLLITVFFTPR